MIYFSQWLIDSELQTETDENMLNGIVDWDKFI